MLSDTARIVLAVKRLDDVVRDLPQPHVDWLSQPEQQRINSFSSATRRQQFLCGRILAREGLGCFHGKPWHNFLLSAPEDAAPRVLSGDHELYDTFISISHTDGWVACAVSGKPVGVDVQSRNKQRDIAGLSQLIDCDLSLEKDSSAENLSRLFYATWALRESWIKHSSGHSSPTIPRFVPSDDVEDPAGGLVSDLGGATLALFPARLAFIELAPGSMPVSGWAAWRIVRN